jgi:hypothetical protein
MKRIARALLPFALVPCTFAFVLTAMPARLYAESGPPRLAECASSEFAACADASTDSACVLNGFAGTCLTRLCIDDAGAGTSASRLACVPSSPTTPPSGSTTPPSGSTTPPGTAGSTTPPTGSTTPPASSSSAGTTPSSAADEAGGCSVGAPLDLGGALSGVAFLSVLGVMLAKRRARVV